LNLYVECYQPIVWNGVAPIEFTNQRKKHSFTHYGLIVCGRVLSRTMENVCGYQTYQCIGADWVLMSPDVQCLWLLIVSISQNATHRGLSIQWQWLYTVSAYEQAEM